MKRIFRHAAIALALTFAHLLVSAQKPTTPMELNDYLATITDTLYKTGQEWGAKFGEVSPTKNYAALSATRRKLEHFIQQKKLEVITMKDIGGSEKLRLAMLEFLFMESRMITEAFLPIEKLNSQSSQDDISKAINFLTLMAERENEFLGKIVEAQKAYGAKNGFTIEGE